MQLRLLRYFKNMIVNFEREVEINNDSVFIYALVNEVKKSKY